MLKNLFLIVALTVLSTSALAANGNIVCKGPFNFEHTLWTGSQTAVHMTFQFYPNRVHGSPLQPKQCQFVEAENVFPEGNILTAFIGINDFLGTPIYLKNEWGSEGTNSSFSLRAGGTSYNLFYHRLLGTLNGTSLDKLRAYVAYGNGFVGNIILIKRIDP